MKFTKKVTVKIPKMSGGKKPGPSRPHFRMRHLSPMGHPSNVPAPTDPGSPAFPPVGGGGMAFNPGVGQADLGAGGGAPDGGGGAPPPAMPGM